MKAKLKQLKVALIHDWLVLPGGAERVLLALSELFPQAPVYTTIYCPENFPQFSKTKIIPSYLNKLPFAARYYPFLLPLMTRAVESFRLSGYDLIISDSHAVAKGIQKPLGAFHFCYCHTPMRYVWYPHIDSRLADHWWGGLFIPYLKKWDKKAASRVDDFIANSFYTQKRIKEIYQRDSEVIYPPVEIKKWRTSNGFKNYFLYVGRLVKYKKPEIVIEAFNQTKLPLKVVGTGPLLPQLKANAQSNIRFLGRVTDEELQKIYRECAALIFPTVEDFGIVPIEVMASGRPVIAYQEGGAAETVVPGVTGEFFPKQSASALVDVLRQFSPEKYQPEVIRQHAEQFDKKNFQQKIIHYLVKKKVI